MYCNKKGFQAPTVQLLQPLPGTDNSIKMNTSACQSLRSVYSSRTSHSIARTFITISLLRDLETNTTTPPPASDLPPSVPFQKPVKDVDYVLSKRGKIPIEKGPVIGSRRRRLAIASSPNIPFSLLPYQCFQEARKIIAADRLDKIQRIEQERRRITEVTAADASTMGGEAIKKGRLKKLEDYLEKLKVLADINDPLVKKRFEDDGGNVQSTHCYTSWH